VLLRRAGDIDGDGTGDYLYNARVRLGSFLVGTNARDERTPALEDRTGKTSVFFGGSPTEGEDQFFYRSLRPVGDLNGDGFADAIALDPEGGTARIFVGSESGYQDSGVTRSLDLGSLDVFRATRAFTDLDGDGLDDVLIGETLGRSEVEILYGASSTEDIETRLYGLEGGGFFTEAAYNTARLRASSDGRIIRLFGQDPVTVQTYSADSTRSLALRQSFEAEELGSAFGQLLSLVDVTGSGTAEIVASDDTTYVFSDTTASSDTLAYGDAPLELTSPSGEALFRPVPIGDVDGDGRHDFFSEELGSIGYGPSDPSDGLTFDTEIPTSPGTDLDARLLPSGRLGDVTGNGQPDLHLTVFDDPGDEFGRRFVDVDSSRQIETDAEVRFPQGHIFDELPEANEIGDVNGDSVGDFAVVRQRLDRIEVYYGGSSIPESSARTSRCLRIRCRRCRSAPGT